MHDREDKLDRLHRLIRAIALAGIVLVLLVISSSAFLRLDAAGLGCTGWPACYGPDHAASVAARPGARLLHRLSATAAGACIVAIALLALTRPRQLRRELVLAALLLAITVFLAVLGRATPAMRVPAAALGNVLGGVTMAALLAWLALVRAPRAGASGSARIAAMIALAVVLVQIALGVLTSASWSGLACTALPGCSAATMTVPLDWAAFDPWRFAVASPTVHMAHRCGALLVLLAMTVLAWRLGPSHGRLRRLLAGVVLAQLALGVYLILGGLPLTAAVAHNALAALLLLAVVVACRRLI